MTVKERIAALRARMKETGIDAYPVSYTHLMLFKIYLPSEKGIATVG